ncbi:related to N2,N2-dimethylguanosine tRNA methyltransferase [Pseudozyma flocculosa]|uniref:tRNA (guanine(26)-N(2))-dimethyltransferase n=2 Tax=Pseudozyma flocculosa TaxID=84751 RepID=A0A5C3EWA7_9BASI|nr:related to N2,N2-dimethylguanosine tRNA methyltransferase [Pseudozyma flocculosa]
MAPTPILLSPSRAKASGITLAEDESAFRENSATIVMPSAEAAFLNPVQEFNRDLSILAIRTWSERLDAEKRNRFLQSHAKAKASNARNANKRKAHRNGNGSGSGGGNGEGVKKVKVDDGSAEASAVTIAGETAEAETKAPEATPATAGGSSDSTQEQQQQQSGPSSGAAPSPAEPAYRPYKFTLLEALSATGLRSIRYAKEIPLLKTVVANDLSPTAVEAMKRNVALNFPPDRPVDEWIASEAKQSEGAGADTAAAAAVSAAGQGSAAELDEDALMELENRAKAKPAAEDAIQASTAATSTDAEAAGSTAEAATTATTTTTKNAIHPDCKVKLNAGDAITLMYMHREPSKRFDVVDLDPYGSASPFLDGGVQSVTDGGLLCVTCTDLAVLAGHNYPEKCFSQYGGVSVKAEFSHEVALRLVLHTIATSAARYGRYIQPLLSLSIDFYMRTFVRVWTGPVEVKKNASKTGTVYVCGQCQNWDVQRLGRATRTENVGKTGQANVNWRYQSAHGPPADGSTGCSECGGRMHLGGPMWMGPLHDRDFCQSALANLERDPSAFNTARRIHGMVSTASSELPEHPFYFTPPKVSGLFHCVSPPLDKVVSALVSAGHDVSRSHASAGSIKTSATRAQVYDVIRAWIKSNPVRMDKIKESDPANRLLAKEAQRDYDFDATDNARVKEVLGEKMMRYQENPQANWGPGTAAKGHKGKKKRNVRPDDLAQ